MSTPAANPAEIRCLSSLADVRAVDEDKREVTYVAATETPVETWRGPEVLRMSGMSARRHIPFLDSHRQSDAGAVIGSLTYEVVGRELHITVRYAKSALAEERWQLVKDGHLRAVSVGYFVRETLVLADGEVNGEGDAEVRGPATIITNWTLIEVSQVALGADENALRRSATEGLMADPAKPATQPENPEPEVPHVRGVEELPEERAARSAEAKTRLVMATCPASLRGYAEQVLFEQPEASADDIRALLRKRYTESHQPVGTPSQPEQPAQTAGTNTDDGKRALGVDEVVNALRSLRS